MDSRTDGKTRLKLEPRTSLHSSVKKSKDSRKRLSYQRKLRSFILTPKDKELQGTFACVNDKLLNTMQEIFSSEDILKQWELYQKQKLHSSSNTDDDLKKKFVRLNVKYLMRVRRTKNLQLASRQLIKSLGGLWLQTKGPSYVGSMGMKIIEKELNEMQQLKSMGILV